MPAEEAAVRFRSDGSGLTGLAIRERRRSNRLRDVHAVLSRARIEVQEIRLRVSGGYIRYEIDLCQPERFHLTRRDWSRVQAEVLDCVGRNQSHSEHDFTVPLRSQPARSVRLAG